MDERDIRITLDQQIMQAAIGDHERLLREDSEFRQEIVDAMETRDVELSLDHQLLQAMVEQLQSQVHSVAESTAHDSAGLQQVLQHRVDAVKHRLDAEVASLHSSSLQLDTELHATIGRLNNRFEKRLAEQVGARDSAMGPLLETVRAQQQDVATLTATVTQLSAELHATLSRSIAAVDARANMSALELTEKLEAESADLASRIDTVLAIANDKTAREARHLSSRAAEARVDDTALSALRDELSEQVAEASASALEARAASLQVESSVASMTVELQQVSARQAALAGVSDRLVAHSLRLDELAANGDAHAVSAAVSTAVVDDVLAELSRELSVIREDLDELRSTIDE
jgi:hypothetical protein